MNFDRLFNLFGGPEEQPAQAASPLELAAAAQLLAPVHEKTNVIRFHTHAANGELVRSRETQHWTPNGLQIRKEDAQVLLQSGLLVKPDEVHVVCKPCGNFETEVYQCEFCGFLCCAVCARRVELGGEHHTICVLCLKELQNRWDTWQEHDRLTQRTSPWRLTPPCGAPVPVQRDHE